MITVCFFLGFSFSYTLGFNIYNVAKLMFIALFHVCFHDGVLYLFAAFIFTYLFL